MLKKEATAITGGLSAPNKMPGPSINLPAVACITGAKLVKVKGSTCSGCYALKGRYRFQNVKDAMQRRLDRLHGPAMGGGNGHASPQAACLQVARLWGPAERPAFKKYF